MSSEAKKLLVQALALSEDERASLVEALGESLEPQNDSLPPEWNDEIRRRIDAVERGESKLIPGDEIEKRVRKVLDGRE